MLFKNNIIKIATVLSAAIFFIPCGFSSAEEKVVIGAEETKAVEVKKEDAAVRPPEISPQEAAGVEKEKAKEPSRPPVTTEPAADENKKPLAPSALTAAAAGGKVKLNWNEVPGVHHYNIYRDTADKITKKASKYNTNQNEFEDEDVSAGETYFYFVTSAVKGKDEKVKYIESDPAGPIKIETEDKTPPQKVESIKIELAENGKVRLGWKRPASANLAEYTVLRGESADPSGAGVPALSEIKKTGSEFFEEDGLDNEKSYFYALECVSKSGVKSGPTSAVHVRLKDTLAPDAPVNIVAAAHASKVELSWQRPRNPDIAYYSIYKSENGETGFKKVSSPELITQEHYTDKAVKGGREYSYRITASDKSANESKMSEPAVSVKMKIPFNISFARSGEKSYYGFSYNMQQSSLYYTESSDGKTWSWWSPIIQNLPLPDGYSDSCRIAFARDGKKILAFVYDTEKMSIARAVSNDEGKNWKWWETYSSSLPLPDGFDENTKISFSVRGNLVYCICFNAEAKTLSAASTSDGQSWKWWKKYGDNLAALPNYSSGSQNSACFYNNQFEAYSYNLDDKTLYKGTLPMDKGAYSSWNEVSAKFPAPPQ